LPSAPQITPNFARWPLSATELTLKGTYLASNPIRTTVTLQPPVGSLNVSCPIKTASWEEIACTFNSFNIEGNWRAIVTAQGVSTDPVVVGNLVPGIAFLLAFLCCLTPSLFFLVNSICSIKGPYVESPFSAISQSTTQLDIEGNNFGFITSDLEVKLLPFNQTEEQLCNITALTTTRITCQLNSSLPLGPLQVSVKKLTIAPFITTYATVVPGNYSTFPFPFFFLFPFSSPPLTTFLQLHLLI